MIRVYAINQTIKIFITFVIIPIIQKPIENPPAILKNPY